MLRIFQVLQIDHNHEFRIDAGGIIARRGLGLLAEWEETGVRINPNGTLSRRPPGVFDHFGPWEDDLVYRFSETWELEEYRNLSWWPLDERIDPITGIIQIRVPMQDLLNPWDDTEFRFSPTDKVLESLSLLGGWQAWPGEQHREKEKEWEPDKPSNPYQSHSREQNGREPQGCLDQIGEFIGKCFFYLLSLLFVCWLASRVLETIHLMYLTASLAAYINLRAFSQQASDGGDSISIGILRKSAYPRILGSALAVGLLVTAKELIFSEDPWVFAWQGVGLLLGLALSYKLDLPYMLAAKTIQWAAKHRSSNVSPVFSIFTTHNSRLLLTSIGIVFAAGLWHQYRPVPQPTLGTGQGSGGVKAAPSSMPASGLGPVPRSEQPELKQSLSAEFGGEKPTAIEGKVDSGGRASDPTAVSGEDAVSTLPFKAKSNIQGLSSSDLRLERNRVYARHGYRFKDPVLVKTFTKEKWYKPDTSDMNIVWSRLAKDEQDYVKEIQREEASRR